MCYFKLTGDVKQRNQRSRHNGVFRVSRSFAEDQPWKKSVITILTLEKIGLYALQTKFLKYGKRNLTFLVELQKCYYWILKVSLLANESTLALSTKENNLTLSLLPFLFLLYILLMFSLHHDTNTTTASMWDSNVRNRSNHSLLYY